MAFFDKLFGSTKQEETSQTFDRSGTTQQTQTQTGTETGTQTQTGSKTGTQAGKTTLFGDEELDVLKNLVQTLSAGVGSAGVDPSIVEALNAAALGAGGDRGEFLSDVEGAARLKFDETQGAALSRGIDTEIGSELNTTSQLLRERSSRDFETQLSGTLASLGIEFDQAQISNLNAAISGGAAASGAEFGPLFQALGLARGAEATTEVESEEASAQQTDTEKLMSALSELIGSTSSTGTSTGTTKTTGQDSIVNQLASLFSGGGDLLTGLGSVNK